MLDVVNDAVLYCSQSDWKEWPEHPGHCGQVGSDPSQDRG